MGFYVQFNNAPSLTVLVKKLYEVASYFVYKNYNIVKINMFGKEHTFNSAIEITNFADSLIRKNAQTVH